MKGAAEKLLSKRNTIYLMLLAIVGVATIFMSNRFKPDTGEAVLETTTQSTEQQAQTYETELEGRLEAILSQIDGAGSTKVMVTLSSGKEIVVEKDSDESSSSENSGMSQSTTTSKKTVIMNTGNGTDTPLIIKQIEPTIEGVVIVAEGGGNEKIREKLIRAAQALLRIESYKVQIFKMK